MNVLRVIDVVRHALMASVAACAGGALADDVRVPRGHVLPLDPMLEESLDAAATFHQVVERYRDLATYEDEVTIEQVTARTGERAIRDETRVACRIGEGGSLDVTTVGEQVADILGLGPIFCGSVAEHHDRHIDLWLAPHLALRYADEPLDSFRSGISEGFTPVKAERVTVEDQPLLRVDLQSGDGLSEDYRAKFELFVDPKTLLITRIRGVQLLPDGANLLTEFIITPNEVMSGDGKVILDRAATTGAAT